MSALLEVTLSAEQMLQNKTGQFTTPQPDIENSGGDELSFAYETYKTKVEAIENENSELKLRIDRWRKMRNIEVDIEILRKEKRIGPNETMIPERIVDKNVTRSVPPYIRFLQQSRRFAIFVPLQDNTLNTEPLEAAFTRACKFKGWEKSFYKLVDGSVFLGADAQEILFDERAPGNVIVKHIGRDRINLPANTEDIEAQDCIVVHQFITSSRLKRFVQKYGWNKAAVDEVISSAGKDSKDSPDITHDIRKVYCKPDGTDYVYVGYMHPSAKDWLKAPAPLYLGRQKKITSIEMRPQIETMPGLDGLPVPVTVMTPVPVEKWQPIYETQYPIYVFTYRETECKKISEYRGRAFSDEYKQEAATALWSGFINRVLKSADIYASPANQTSSGTGVPKISTEQLKPNAIYDNPIAFWSAPGPEPSMGNALQMLATNTTDDINQPAWTVNNRRDSEKTATEITTATQKESEINTVELMLFSVYLRDVFTRLWEIIKNRAEQGKISFLEGNKDRERLLSQPYDIFAAGDVDVIKRAEDIQKMRLDWPVIQTTAAAPLFLIDYIQKSYPDSAHRYIAAIQQSMQQQQSQAALLKVIQGLVDQFGSSIAPEQMAQIQQIIKATTPHG